MVFLHSLLHPLLPLPQLFSPETSSTAIVSTFPRVTKCKFQNIGPYGKLTTTRHQCLLPQNIINEKVFIAMWFWLIILATITAIEVSQREVEL